MTYDNHALSEIATGMLADYDAVTPGSVFRQGLRITLPDAWRLQTAITQLREARGEKVIGYKVGAVTPGNQKMMGLPHPVWGRLWDSELHSNGAELKKASYANIAIEAEFGITLSGDLVPGMSIDEIAASVAAIYPTLELHNLVLHSDRPHGPELVANNCIHCGVVRGAAVPLPDTASTTDLELIYDGKIVDGWQTLRWPNDILAAVVWLTGALEEHNLCLRKGDLILTSAWGPPIPVEDHTRVDVTSSAFGNVFATFR